MPPVTKEPTMSRIDEDHEMRLRAIERSLLEHITRCDGRARANQWIMVVGFIVLAVLGMTDGPAGKVLLSLIK